MWPIMDEICSFRIRACCPWSSIRLRLGAAKSRFILSNLSILESLFCSPQWRYYELKKTVINSVDQTKRSSTWKNYNRHYGRTRAQAPEKTITLYLGILWNNHLCNALLVSVHPIKIIQERNPQALIYTIIALNGAVFVMWNFASDGEVLTRYGLLVKDNVSNWAMVI